MYNRPALSDIIQRVRDDLVSRLALDDILRRADSEVFARVMGGVANGLYGYIDWLSDQIIYDTASVEYLERWCSIWGITRVAAASAIGTVSFTVQVGAVIPSGTLLQALDGIQYQTTADAVIVGLTASAPISAVIAGKDGNRTAGQSLTIVTPISGVGATALASLISGGADIETDDALRARLLTRIQTPPQGGSQFDYIAWALQVSGVTRAWVYPNELGLGTVTLRFVRDNDVGSIIPDSTEVATVQAYIDALRPVTSILTVVAPTAVPVNFTIGVTPNNSTVQAAVQAELQDLFTREATPGGTIYLSHIRAAISAAAGETNYTMSVPSADIVSTTGNISTLGTITWV